MAALEALLTVSLINFWEVVFSKHNLISIINKSLPFHMQSSLYGLLVVGRWLAPPRYGVNFERSHGKVEIVLRIGSQPSHTRCSRLVLTLASTVTKYVVSHHSAGESAIQRGFQGPYPFHLELWSSGWAPA